MRTASPGHRPREFREFGDMEQIGAMGHAEHQRLRLRRCRARGEAPAARAASDSTGARPVPASQIERRRIGVAP